jgi:pentatricopeptide repeat protein
VCHAQACERAGEWERAVALLRRAAAAGVPPSTFSYNFAMGACVKAGRADRAMELLAEMQAEVRLGFKYCRRATFCVVSSSLFLCGLQRKRVAYLTLCDIGGDSRTSSIRAGQDAGGGEGLSSIPAGALSFVKISFLRCREDLSHTSLSFFYGA